MKDLFTNQEWDLLTTNEKIELGKAFKEFIEKIQFVRTKSNNHAEYEVI